MVELNTNKSKRVIALAHVTAEQLATDTKRYQWLTQYVNQYQDKLNINLCMYTATDKQGNGASISRWYDVLHNAQNRTFSLIGLIPFITQFSADLDNIEVNDIVITTKDFINIRKHIMHTNDYSWVLDNGNYISIDEYLFASAYGVEQVWYKANGQITQQHYDNYNSNQTAIIKRLNEVTSALCKCYIR